MSAIMLSPEIEKRLRDEYEKKLSNDYNDACEIGCEAAYWELERETTPEQKEAEYQKWRAQRVNEILRERTLCGGYNHCYDDLL